MKNNEKKLFMELSEEEKKVISNARKKELQMRGVVIRVEGIGEIKTE